VDGQAAASARDIGARAYTVGNHIAFADGKYAPDTHAGRELLAHELTHVVQQGFGRAPIGVQRAPATTPPSPPGWLGSLRTNAVHVKGNIWDVKIPSLGGDVWVGPYSELTDFIKAQGYAGKMEAAHILGGEHLGDISSAFPYDRAPCVAVDKSLHATWTQQTTFLQTKYFGGRKTKATERPALDTAEVTSLYEELYSDHPELQEMAGNIVALPNKRARVKMMPKANPTTMPERTPPMPERTPPVQKPTSPMDAHAGSPMPKPTSAMPERTSPMDAHTGSPMPKRTPAMPEPASPMTGELESGRVVADYDARAPTDAIKLKKINLADYPVEKPGPITRFFRDRPVLRQLGAAGAHAAAEYLRNKTIDMIESHFQSELGDARAEFDKKFPDVGSLRQRADLDSLIHAYSAALWTMRVPDAKRKAAMVMLLLTTPEKDREARAKELEQSWAKGQVGPNDKRSFLDIGKKYENALADLASQTGQNVPTLYAIADDIDRRAAVLNGAGNDLENLFFQIASTPAVVFPTVEGEAINIKTIADTFKSLGGSMGALGNDVRSRGQDYQRFFDALDAELTTVGTEIDQLGVGTGFRRVGPR
jgi:hypothetical protein